MSIEFEKRQDGRAGEIVAHKSSSLGFGGWLLAASVLGVAATCILFAALGWAWQSAR